MPATHVVVLDPEGRIAAELRAAVPDLPVWIRAIRRTVDLEAALAAAYPVAIVAAQGMSPADLAQVAGAIWRRGAPAVIVGRFDAWETLDLLREAGAVAIPPATPAPHAWKALLSRIVRESQLRYERTG